MNEIDIVVPSVIFGLCGGVVVAGCIIYSDLEPDEEAAVVSKLEMVETAVGFASAVALGVYIVRTIKF